jgi:hypothetical protein
VITDAGMIDMAVTAVPARFAQNQSSLMPSSRMCNLEHSITVVSIFVVARTDKTLTDLVILN